MTRPIESFPWGDHTPAQRRAVLELLIALHTTPPAVFAGQALVDD